MKVFGGVDHQVYTSSLRRGVQTAGLCMDLPEQVSESQQLSIEEMIDENLRKHRNKETRPQIRREAGRLISDSRFDEMSFGEMEGVSLKSMTPFEREYVSNM